MEEALKTWLDAIGCGSVAATLVDNGYDDLDVFAVRDTRSTSVCLATQALWMLFGLRGYSSLVDAFLLAASLIACNGAVIACT